MKKLLFTIGVVLTLSLANAQTAPDYSKYPLDTEANIKKANDAALQTANYVLGTPINKDPQQRLEALQFLLMWMQGTPDYSFAIDNTFSLVGEDQQMMGLYLAAMIKHQVDNKIKQGGPDVSVATLKTIAEYIDNPAHNAKATGELKKMVEANKAGKLKEFVEKMNKE